MSDSNRRAKEWAEALATGEALLHEMRTDAIKLRDGWRRRATLRMIAWLHRWVERGRRWRDKDLRDD